MAGFARPDSFVPVASALQLLPIRFERLGADRFLVGNMVGDMTEMTQTELDRLCALDLAPGDGLYERAFEKLFIGSVEQRAQQQLLGASLAQPPEFLASGHASSPVRRHAAVRALVPVLPSVPTKQGPRPLRHGRGHGLEGAGYCAFGARLR